MSLKIHLSSNPIKYNAKASVVGRDRLYTTSRARFAQSKHPLVSHDANDCTMICLNGGTKYNCLMHLAPEQQPLTSLKSGIEKCIKTLMENMGRAQENITAIIVGGRDSSHKESFNLFNETANILEEMGIPFSMICGKFDHVANDNIVVAGNKAQIWNSSLKGLNSTSPKELANILEENYEVVELSPEVPVEFIG